MTREDAWKPVASTDRSLDTGLLSKILDELYGTRYQFLSEDSLERISDANDFYEYYDLEGQYWDMPNSLGYDPTIMPINLARWFVRRRSSWMFEVAPDIECPAETVDSPDEMEKKGYEPSPKQVKLDNQASAREQMLYEVWGENNFDEKLMAGAVDYFIGGTTALRIRYLPNKGIKLDFSPTQEIFPVPDEDEPEKLKSITFCSYKDNDQTVWKQTWELQKERCYLTEGLYSSKNLEAIEMRYSKEDTLLDFIPVLLFPNEALSQTMFGTSFLKDLIPMFDQYNRSMSDAADSLRFNLFAITVLLNAPPDAEKELKVAPNELWNIGGDQVDAKKLESSFQYANALADFLTRLENLMHLISEVPDITPDRIRGFGLVSGVALKLLYSDLVSATQRAWRIWKSRLITANEYILRMIEVYGNTAGFPYDFKSRDVRERYVNRIIPHLPLPENELEQINMETLKMKSSLQSVKGALQELGEKYPERKIAEILSERDDFGVPNIGKEVNVQEMEVIEGA